MNHAFTETYERVSEMVGPTLPVNYPRLPGHKPRPEENKYNAWWVTITLYMYMIAFVTYGRRHQITCLRGLRTTNAQTSLRIRTD